jgi:D-alanine--D-alanine ligase
MSKVHVAVIRGGPSSEYDVSLKTGSTVLKTLSEKYRPIDIFISQDGIWHRDGAERSPDRALVGADVVFNALHGQFGEDGKVQKILDDLGVPYTGSNALASAVGMNKILAKQAFARAGVKTPYYAVIRKDDDVREKYNYVFHHFLLPFVVKPAGAGSSAGVSVVKNYVDFYTALEAAFAHDDTAIVEEYIRGREATCAVIDNFRGNRFYSLPPVEIIYPKTSEFFDYAAKYGDPAGNPGISVSAQEICPGNFSAAEKKELEWLAAEVHRVLGARHYSRTDFMVSPRRGIFVLEINTLPGLTSASLLPKSLNAVGLSLSDFFDHVIALAMGGK